MKKTNEAIVGFFRENNKRFAPETKRSYALSLQQFLASCLKEYDEVKSKDIRDWLLELEDRRLKPRTINLKLAAVKAFYKYMEEETLITKNPLVNVHAVQVGDSLPAHLDQATLTEFKELTLDSPRERAMLQTLYTTGVRVSELLHIRLDDIKWETRQIIIHKGKSNKDRIVLFTSGCEERLKSYLTKRKLESPYLFANFKGEPLSVNWVDKQFRRYTKELKTDYKITPHTIRHTFATHLAEKQMPQSYIQELLGHVNINTTRIYTRPSPEARKKKFDRYQ
ncbi:Integrase-recombinase protein [Candidatus Desulfosporosinus infrequens]|uniref:Integrase-recombinase protein n=1 Tax=Candidatus Desulfosporosinus infrequens TaxID=2043169 RepID=A0A2U3LMA3_9FIRM|nr:Integrase-recombinase protein [Candidatus Desulfosporosinus infrequens]